MKKSAFTLIELLVVVCVLSILIAISLLSIRHCSSAKIIQETDASIVEQYVIQDDQDNTYTIQVKIIQIRDKKYMMFCRSNSICVVPLQEIYKPNLSISP